MHTWRMGCKELVVNGSIRKLLPDFKVGNHSLGEKKTTLRTNKSAKADWEQSKVPCRTSEEERL